MFEASSSQNALKMKILYSKNDCTRDLPTCLVPYYLLCPCYNDARECAGFVIKCLAGNNGELCARWKEFHVDVGHGPDYKTSKILALALSYPAPSLTSLKIANLIVDEGEDQNVKPLIQMPRLQAFVVRDCYLLQVPSFQTLLKLELDGTHHLHLGGRPDLRSASQLQALCLRYMPADKIILPEQFPNLTSLEIIGYKFSTALHSCQIPNLSTVAFDFDVCNPILDILAWPGIDIQKLQKLSLTWSVFGLYLGRWMPEDRQDMFESLQELLNRVPNLCYVAGNHLIVSLFLKILWDSWSEHGSEGILGSKQFSLHLIVKVGPGLRKRTIRLMAEFNGNDHPGILVTLAKEWGLPSPALPIAEVLNLLPKLPGVAQPLPSVRSPPQA